MDFTIPSVHDGVVIQCRIQHPHEIYLSPTSGTIFGAIVAHPYAPLGGCQDDPVVKEVCDTMLEDGLVLGTFNFRGAGSSGGRTSLSGKPEEADYQSFILFFTIYLLHLRHYNVGDLKLLPEQRAVCLIIAGYSYGSMIASRIPAPSSAADMFPTISALSTQQHEQRTGLISRAEQFFEESINTVVASRNKSSRTLDVDYAKPFVNPSYLLVSPILPPITGFLAPFSGKSLFTTKAAEFKQLTTYPTLVCWGMADGFTSNSRLKSWVEDVTQLDKPCSRLQSAQINGAGHFWRESGAMSALKDTVRAFVRDRVLSSLT